MSKTMWLDSTLRVQFHHVSDAYTCEKSYCKEEEYCLCEVNKLPVSDCILIIEEHFSLITCIVLQEINEFQVYFIFHHYSY